MLKSPLVGQRIAIRVRENLPVRVDLDDLVHAGVLGLVEKFDGSKPVAFQAYAKHPIKGPILDSLREVNWRRATCASGRSAWTRLPATCR